MNWTIVANILAHGGFKLILVVAAVIASSLKKSKKKEREIRYTPPVPSGFAKETPVAPKPAPQPKAAAPSRPIAPPVKRRSSPPSSPWSGGSAFDDLKK